MKNLLIKLYLQKIKGLRLPKDLIRYGVRRNFHKIAVIDGGREITYGALYERAKKLANALQGLGLKKGDKLAVLLYNCQEYFEIRIATYLTGIVLVPIIWDMELEDIVFILKDCQVKALIYHPSLLDRRDKNVPPIHFIEIVPSGAMGRGEAISYETLLSQGSSVEPSVKLKPADLASINFSSGTTGRPKGIMLTHGNWVASFYNYLLNLPRLSKMQVVYLVALPLATSGSTGFLPMFAVGAKQVILKKFAAEEASVLILKHKINTLFMSPSIFLTLMDYCKAKSIKLSLMGIAVGTENFPQAKFKEAVEFFGPVIQRGYGMAEVLPPLTLICSRNYCRNATLDRRTFPTPPTAGTGMFRLSEYGDILLDESKLLSVGYRLQGVNIKIIDGRIAVKGATISKGYWHNSELNAKHYKDGWFYTNDYGYFDKEGFLYVLGRNEDILREIDGKPFFAGQIEEVLHRHPSVLQACAFKTEKDKIIAYVSLRAGAKNTTPEKLANFCKEKLPKEAMPNKLMILPELPIRATGKLDRVKIKQSFLAQ